MSGRVLYSLVLCHISMQCTLLTSCDGKWVCREKWYLLFHARRWVCYCARGSGRGHANANVDAHVDAVDAGPLRAEIRGI